jgi:putative DNA primase/helicase
MREDFTEFTPTHKLVVYVNDLPKVRDTSEGYWRRMRVVRFPVDFRGREDMLLDAKLKAELPGILAWAVRGCIAWQRDGLGEPASVKAETTAYRESEDLIGRWLADYAAGGKPSKALARRLSEDFTAWADQNGERHLSATALGLELARRGYPKRATHEGKEWDLTSNARRR